MSRTHRRARSAGTRSVTIERSAVSVFVAALVCLALVLAPSLWLGPRAQAASEVGLQVAAGNLGIVDVGSDVTFTVVVTRTDTQPIGAGRVQIRLDRTPLAGRSALAAWLDPAQADQSATGTVVATVAVRATTGDQATVTATVPAGTMKLTAGAVYRVEATYSLNAEAQESAATARSTVTANAPGGVGTLAVLAPLTAPVRTTGVIPADELARLTADDGELSLWLTALQNRPVSIGLDPMLLASIRLLGTAAPGSAAAWLERLAAAPNETFALQYADADIAAQSQAGIGLLAPTSFEFAIEDSLFGESSAEPAPEASPPVGDRPNRPTVDSLTAWPYALDGIGWPAAATVTAGDLDLFAESGLGTTILDDSSVDRTPGDSGAHVRIGGHQALVADSAITSALHRATSAPSDAIWSQAMSDLFAQLALRAEPARSTPTLATLARDSSNIERLDATLAALADQRLVVSTSLGALLRAPASDATIVDSPEPADRIAQVNALNDRAGQIAQLATAATTPEALTGRYRADMLALLATGWLADPVTWQQTVSDSLTASAGLLDDVRLASMSDVQMFGGQVAIPITVINDLSLPVTVRVQAVPSNGRLVVDSDVVWELAAGSQTKVLVPVTARIGNGQVTVSVTLFNEDMSVQLDGPEHVSVTVRADWESFGTLILAVLVVGFFGLGIWRGIRRRRRARIAEAAETADDGTGADAVNASEEER